MAFSFEDILEELVGAAQQGQREYFRDGFSFGSRRDWMSPEQYRQWLNAAVARNRHWRRDNLAAFKAWRSAHRKRPEYRAWERTYMKAWRAANPELAKAQGRRRRARIKADPARREKKRQQDREAKRRERARKKNGLQ